MASHAPAVSHILFADDCIIFSGASKLGVDVVKDVLKVYEGASSQKVTYDTTDVCFSAGVLVERRRRLANRLNVRLVECHEKYLGLPTVGGGGLS